jgi:tyrosyl-DNA phosphodiesterase-1
MIQGDWTNMTQAVWRSPLLPLEKSQPPSRTQAAPPEFGSGARFKRDLLAYLKAYGPSKTGSLYRQLNGFDFGAVRAALVASVPSRQHASDFNSDEDTLWGWLALKDVTSRIPTRQKGDKSRQDKASQPHIVIQVHRCNLTHWLRLAPNRYLDFISSDPWPNKQMAQRRLLQSTRSNTTRH